MALYGKIKAKLIGKPFCTMVVLAAGSSKRMGRDKLMMEVGGVPVITPPAVRLTVSRTGMPGAAARLFFAA